MTDLFKEPIYPTPPPELPVLVRRFTAAFDSDCEGCGGDIYADEPAGYIGDCCDQAEEGTP